MNKKLLKIVLSLVLPVAASDMLKFKKHKKDSAGAEHFASELTPEAHIQLEHNNLDKLLKLAEQNKALNTSSKLDKKIKIFQANTAHAQSLLQQGLPIESKLKFAENLVTRHEYEEAPENELNPLLLQAILQNSHDQVEKLLDDGADVDCKTKFSVSALALSAKSANLEIFKLLLTRNPAIQGENSYSETILHQACKGNNPKIISALLGTKQLPKKYLDHISAFEETPLKLAIRNSNPAIFAQLLKVGAQLQDSDLVDEEIMQAIQEQIIRARSSTEQKTLNKQFLDVVKSSDTSSIINYVCNGADVNARDDLGETALMIAVKSENEDTIDQLLKLGANINAQNYFGGVTATHKAVQSACLPIIKKLVSSKADLTIKDDNQLTPIMLAQQINRGAKSQIHNDIEQYLLQVDVRRKLYKKLFSASIGLSIGVGATLTAYSIWQKSR
jgi:ankyrin repeat protein